MSEGLAADQEIALTKRELVAVYEQWRGNQRSGGCLTSDETDSLPLEELVDLDAKTFMDYLGRVRDGSYVPGLGG